VTLLLPVSTVFFDGFFYIFYWSLAEPLAGAHVTLSSAESHLQTTHRKKICECKSKKHEIEWSGIAKKTTKSWRNDLVQSRDDSHYFAGPHRNHDIAADCIHRVDTFHFAAWTNKQHI